jgi:hypothetical protein
MTNIRAGFVYAAIIAAMVSATSIAAQARWRGDRTWAGDPYASSYFYHLPLYYSPYGFRYVGNPDFPGCYFAKRSGPYGTYSIPVC